MNDLEDAQQILHKSLVNESNWQSSICTRKGPLPVVQTASFAADKSTATPGEYGARKPNDKPKKHTATCGNSKQKKESTVGQKDARGKTKDPDPSKKSNTVPIKFN